MTRLSMRTRLTLWFAASILLILAPYLAGMLVLEWRSMRAALDHHLEEDLEANGFRSRQTPAGANVRVLSAQRTFGGTPLWIRVVRSEDGLRQDFWILLLLFSIATPLAVLGAALAGYVISGRALSPLARMAERARSISAEHLSRASSDRPPEQRTRVLERFYRIDGWRDQGPWGAGLGLAIVHRAVTANQGRVVIDSNESGGARVVLSLPRHDAGGRIS